MVNVNVIGRLGADSELKTSVNGRQYVSLRLATDQYNRKTKENETIWFNVVDFSEKALKMQSTLKKGSMINVFGVERIGLFQGKNGETLIGREIISDRIEFVSSGSKSQQTINQDSSYANTIKNSVAEVEALKTAQPIFETVNSSSSVDDLPF